jgi:hypothetical protein
MVQRELQRSAPDFLRRRRPLVLRLHGLSGRRGTGTIRPFSRGRERAREGDEIDRGQAGGSASSRSAKLSAWIAANFETEEWWIREHFLCAAKYAGDESLLPLLRKIAETPPKDDPSEKRQVEEAREALSALEAGRK